VAGRLLLVWRLLVRDLRRRPAETVLLLVAITAATGTLTIGLALGEVVTEPYRQTRAATAGPDVVVTPTATGQEARAALAPLTTLPNVTGHSGPFPVAFLDLTAQGKIVHAVVEGRDAAPSALDRPAVTDGTWVRPGGVVVERAFADALGVRTGETVRVEGRALRVVGIAVTAARTTYPYAGWHFPGSVLAERGGLVWVDHADLPAIAGDEPLSYTLNLRLADPSATASFAERARSDVDGYTFVPWQEIAERDARPVEQAQQALMVGSWLLAILAVAGVVGIVAGRVLGRRRRVGLLKATGAGPAMVAAVHLAEYLVLGVAAAGAGLAVGLLVAPLLVQPTAGLLGAVGTQSPTWRMVASATGLALAIAVAATLVPVVRAATTSTVHALADAAVRPRRRRWLIGLSRRLPTALLIGIRVNARRPRRARLVTVNTFVTTTVLVAVLMNQAQDKYFEVGRSELIIPQAKAIDEAMLVITVVLVVLALINAVVATWTAVLDARQPLAVARTLGATPGQAGMGLAVAQLLPAIPGAVAGVPAGVVLYVLASRGQIHYAPGSWLIAAAVGVLLATTALTALPAMAIARRPVAESLATKPA
jgi:putative ABC transport system permease protein